MIQDDRARAAVRSRTGPEIFARMRVFMGYLLMTEGETVHRALRGR
jgi:hypothetical protein